MRVATTHAVERRIATTRDASPGATKPSTPAPKSRIVALLDKVLAFVLSGIRDDAYIH